MTMLKALVITFFGIMVCAGILSSFVTFLVLGTLPHEDIVMGAVFSALAAAVIGVSLRAMFRVEKEGGTGSFAFLARMVPVLILVGAGAGVWFALSVQNTRNRYAEERAVQLCEHPAFWSLSPDACLEVARVCVKHREVPAPADAVAAFTQELSQRASAADARDRAHQEDPDPLTTKYVERLNSDFFTNIAPAKTRSELICMASQRR